MLAPLKRLKLASNKPYREGAILLGVAFLAIFALAGCAGRNLHPELSDDPGVLVRRWTLPTHGSLEAGERGTEYSNPVFYENTLIFGNSTVGLTSIYPIMNQQRWALKIHNGVTSELAVDRGTVFFGGGDGFLYAVNAETGKVLWKYELRNPTLSRPTISGGRVFVTTSDDMVVALDAATGKWLWHYRRRTSPSASIHSASAPLVDGGEVLAGMTDGYLVSLNENDGQLKWERKLHYGTKFTDVDAHPVLENGRIYIPSYDGALYALNRQGGTVIWRYDAGGSKTVVLEGDVIYLPSSDGAIHAIRKDNATLVWRFELDGGVPTQLAVTDQYLIVGSSFQYFYVIDKRTGRGLYRFNSGYGSGFAGSPAFDAATQRVYALSNGGNLYSFSLRKPPRKAYPHGYADPYRF